MDDHRRTGDSMVGRRGAPLQIVRALRSGHWPTLLGAWLHFEVSFMVWLLVGALSVAIASELGLSATEKGLLVALPLLSGALLRIPVGISSDHMGAKRTGLAILLCELAGLGWAWLGASSYLHMLLTGLLLGVAGASFAVALPLASRVYPPAHQGLAMGIAASANSGTVLAMWFAPRIAELTRWQGAFGVMAAPVLMTMLLFAGLVQSDRRLGRTGAISWRLALVDIGRDPFLYGLCGLYAITFGGALYLEPGPELEGRLQDLINRLWAGELDCEERDEVLAALKRLTQELFAPGLSEEERLRIAEGNTKALYVHAHMDEETFDTDRIRACPVGVREPDGTNVPSCAYNVLYRERDSRFMKVPRPPLHTTRRAIARR